MFPYLAISQALSLVARICVYVYLRITYLALLFRIKGKDHHKYSKDITLNFDGFNPITWSDSEFNYVSGLPEKIHEGRITIEHTNNGEKFHFDSEHGVINWRSFFDNIPQVVFHDDLD